MSKKQYIALLRGINVGGRNKISMSDLRDVFVSYGYENVETYIQSGNVLFASDAKRDTLEGSVERMLANELDLPIVVVVRSFIQMRNVVANAPDGFGKQPDEYHSDVAFLKAPLTGRQAAKAVVPRHGVDRIWGGTGVMYFQRLSARRSQSRMSRITQTSEYELMTIRNWNTTTKLLQLLGERRS